MKTFRILILFFFILSMGYSQQGKVYLVLGSDTAIWDGLDVNRYHDTYKLDLYTNPSMNAYKAIDATFRAQFRDSYNNPLKITWWMMTGNVYRFATNTNVPAPNSMTLYLIKKYHAERLRQVGDELSLHYHSWVWTDYNNDGKYYWNQARSFAEYREDFDITLADCLLEEGVFPVSFRSGWEFMDNDWQNDLENILPFSMHNVAGAVRKDTVEPFDNIIDWSRAPKTWVPYHPSATDYQTPGNLKGYNLRAVYFASTSASTLNQMFAEAKNGIDQVACLWAHLPEVDFLTQIKRVDSLVHYVAKNYPTVQFQYCTAVEAMQLWMKTSDRVPPMISMSEEAQGDSIKYFIQTDELLFQDAPFVAHKDRNEQVAVLPCDRVGSTSWRTIQAIPRSMLGKIAVAATDTSGNVGTKFIRYLPDDQYIDNEDAGYEEISGQWTTTPTTTWGTTSRISSLQPPDTVCVRWTPQIVHNGLYNVFVQVPFVANPARNINFYLKKNNIITDTIRFIQPISVGDWVYITTTQLDSSISQCVEMVAVGIDQIGTTLAIDVMKFSAYIRERQLKIADLPISFGEISESDTAKKIVRLKNGGVLPLTISRIWSRNPNIVFDIVLPYIVPAMGTGTLHASFIGTTIGSVLDTLFIQSDDPSMPIYSLPFTVAVKPYFFVIDNDDSLHYREYGQWYTSSSPPMWGSSSRYAWLRDVGVSARFSTTLKKWGVFEIEEIIPKTVNTSTRAMYKLIVNGQPADSIILNQNNGSGVWKKIMRKRLPAMTPIELTVRDANGATSSDIVVLRTDGMRFSFITQAPDEATQQQANLPLRFALEQNYPNPFNAETIIDVRLPVACRVRLAIFNVLGQQVALLVNGERGAGYYKERWHAQTSSGMYILRLEAIPLEAGIESYSMTKKMIMIR